MSDQAPEPVAWQYTHALTKSKTFSNQPPDRVMGLGNYECVPLYLAPPTEAAIRASERERCAQLCETIDRSDPSDDATALACADAIRELGDE